MPLTNSSTIFIFLLLASVAADLWWPDIQDLKIFLTIGWGFAALFRLLYIMGSERRLSASPGELPGRLLEDMSRAQTEKDVRAQFKGLTPAACLLACVGAAYGFVIPVFSFAGFLDALCIILAVWLGFSHTRTGHHSFWLVLTGGLWAGLFLAALLMFNGDLGTLYSPPALEWVFLTLMGFLGLGLFVHILSRKRQNMAIIYAKIAVFVFLSIGFMVFMPSTHDFYVFYMVGCVFLGVLYAISAPSSSREARLHQI